MGQYFKLINLDKKQWVHAHKIGNGLKHGEQTGWKYSTERVALHLIDGTDSRHPLIGTWAGDRIIFASDCGQTFPVAGAPPCDVPDAENLYGKIEESADWSEISARVREMMTAIYGITYTGTGWLDILEPNGANVRPFMTPDMVLSLGK